MAATSATSASRSPTAATSAASTACPPRACRGWTATTSSATRRSRGSSSLLASMGVHDVRLTGGEPLARRELWKLVELLSPDENIHDLSLTTNGYLLERQVEKLVRGRPAPRQRLARRARARPLLPAHPPQLAPAGPRRAGRGRAAPRAAPDQGQRRRAEGLHRGRGRALRRVRPQAPVRGPLHRVHAARRRPHVVARPRAAQRRGPAADPRRLPAQGHGPRAPRHVAALGVRRRAGLDRLHLPRPASPSAATATGSASPPRASCAPACSR